MDRPKVLIYIYYILYIYIYIYIYIYLNCGGVLRFINNLNDVATDIFSGNI